jgi:beta-glucanase (GH16 family)
MNRRLLAVGALAVLCLLVVGLILAGHRGPATGTSSFAGSAGIVSVDPASRALVVALWSGSRSVEALRGQGVTLHVAETATIAQVRGEGRSLTLGALRPGTPVEIAGTIDRTVSAAPRFSVTRIIARKLVWSDEFNGPAGAAPDPGKWHADVGSGLVSNYDLEYDTARASNVALDGRGHLAITAQRETYGGAGSTRDYTSGKIESLGRFSTTYGFIQARIKVPPGLGLWPAFGGFGNDIDTVGWPMCGEIDAMECIGREPFTVFSTVHGPSTASSDGYGLTISHQTIAELSEGFHVYGLNWAPNFVQMTLDGVPYATYTPRSLSDGQRWVFNKPFFLILDLAVGGAWDGAPDATTPFPATMLVDWVRVYSWR